MKTFKTVFGNICNKSRKSFIITFVITVSVLFALFLVLQITNRIKYNNSTVFICGFIILFGFVISYKISGAINSFSDKFMHCIGLVLFCIFPLADIFFISPVNKHYFFDNVEIIIIPYIILFLIFRRSYISIIFTSVTTLFLYLLDDIVLTLRGVGVNISDIFAIDTALSVSSNYSVNLKEEYILSIVVTVFFCVTSVFFPLKLKFKFISARSILSFFKENLSQDLKKIKNVADFLHILFFALLLYILFFSIYNVYQTMEQRSTLRHWGNQDDLNYTGTVYKLLMQIKESSLSAPNGYSSKEAENILSRYKESDGLRNPNIIIIMNESFSDLRNISDIELNEENMSFYNSLDKNVTKGNVVVNGYGGITCNSEFEFLTGISMANMPKNSFPYLQYINRDIHTVIRDLDSSLYRKDYTHPFIASNYKRSYLYPFLGFDRFYDGLSFSTQNFYSEEYGGRSEPVEYEGVELIRGFIGDETTYDKVIDLYENKSKDERLAEFIITIQNHGGYIDEDSGFISDIKSGTGSDEVDVYLSLIKKSDEALEKIIKYFSKADEDTVIVFFGDHRPNLTDTYPKSFENSREHDLAYYSTPFLIWTNYDTETEYIDYVSLNYLSVLMKNKAQMSLTKYDKFLMELYENYPILSDNFIIDCNNNYNAEYDLSKDSLLVDYGILSYYYLFDWQSG